MQPRFLTKLVGECTDDCVWIVREPLIYQSLLAGVIEVPEGFRTDLASVPRLPIIYTLFGNRAHHESVVHDFLYQTHLTSKPVADKVFLEAMVARGKPFHIRWPMYWGVVLGGVSSYISGPARLVTLNA